MHPLFCSSASNSMSSNKFSTPIHGLALVLLITSLASTTSSCREQEKTSLLRFLAGLTQDGGLAASWRNGTDCCTWEGITCSTVDGMIEEVSLADRRLEGRISPSLGSLASLSRLNLSHNSLSGAVPPALSSSHSIAVLDVSFNRLSWNLPQEQPSSSALDRRHMQMQVINISSNSFTGQLSPATWGMMENLVVLNASNNSFTGSIPSFLCQSAPFLTVLDISYNKFSGSVRPELGKCSMLRSLKAGRNNLTGTLPDELFNVTSLRHLCLPNNGLHGALDPALIIKLINLVVLDLGWNMISGNIPDSIGQLKGLKELRLDHNSMSGELPSALGDCRSLVTMNLNNNDFSGELGKINFSTLSNLKTLNVGWNNFTGIIPESVYLCSKLTVLQLSFNKLRGQLSPRARHLKSLTVLSLAGNNFTNIKSALQILKSSSDLTTLLIGSNFRNEEIPGDETIDGFENIKVLAMEDCQLFGKIPLWITHIRDLEMLFLFNNELTGSIPVGIGTLNFLFYIDLSNNGLTGEIPAGLMEMPMLRSDTITTSLDPKGSELPTYSGPSPQYYTLGAFPALMNLGNNNLTGVIPPEIGQLKALVSLILGFNRLSGEIPRAISNLTNLEALDLSNNHLTGTIPGALNNLHFLSRFNISNNDLEGSVPHGGQFDTFPSTSFDGNSKVCASMLVHNCHSVEVPKGSTEQGYKVMFAIAFGVFFGLGVLLDQLCLSRLFG
ncbi:uncharacterized protein [Aegilops tauschii subsp. strangulata]|nr:receptor-like protein 2 [Aegilops tauschii subsp. strangulata]